MPGACIPRAKVGFIAVSGGGGGYITYLDYRTSYESCRVVEPTTRATGVPTCCQKFESSQIKNKRGSGGVGNLKWTAAVQQWRQLQYN